MRVKKLFWVIVLAALSLWQGCQPARSPQNQKEGMSNPAYRLFVGTYTDAETPSGKSSEGIYVYDWDPAQASLELWGKSDFIPNPSYLAVKPGGQFVYAVSETAAPHGKLASFRVDTAGKRLQLVGQVSTQGAHPCHVSLCADNRYALVANYSGGNVAMLPIKPDGSLGEASAVMQHSGSGPTARQTAPHAHMILPLQGTPFAFAADLGTDEIRAYEILPEKAGLQTVGTLATSAGMGPRHIAFHPHLQVAYVLGELDGHIEACLLDKETGGLSRFQRIPTVKDTSQAPQAGCAAIHVHPDGKWLYASNRGDINSIACYAIDQATGELQFVDEVPVPAGPRSFTIDPTGHYLLAGSQYGHKITIFSIDPQTGLLRSTGNTVSVPAPVCLVFS